MVKPQTCKRCGRVQHVVWHVSDEIWREMCQKVGWPLERTLCLECFAELMGFVDLGDISRYVYKTPLWDK